MNKAKLHQWEEGIAQARNVYIMSCVVCHFLTLHLFALKACDAWKKEAEESGRKAKVLAQERDEVCENMASQGNFCICIACFPGFSSSDCSQERVGSFEEQSVYAVFTAHD
jgi:hypothetical protein